MKNTFIKFCPKKIYYLCLITDYKGDLYQGIKVLRFGRITMGKKTIEFENLQKKNKYALMVNSDLQPIYCNFASCNPKRKKRFKPGDNAIIQSLCWPTSLWPLVQSGLKIKFVDINPQTLNVNVEEIIKNVDSRTKVILIINVLGLSTNMNYLRKFCQKKKIILIEDNCIFRAKYDKTYLGKFGDLAPSLFYSHQITSGEGGMITCKNKEDYEILKSLRLMVGLETQKLQKNT